MTCILSFGIRQSIRLGLATLVCALSLQLPSLLEAADPSPIEVNVGSTPTLGVGFGELSPGAHTLTVKLNATGAGPGGEPLRILSSDVTFPEGNVIWNPRANQVPAFTHQYTAVGVLGDTNHSAVFRGLLGVVGGGPGGGGQEDPAKNFDVHVTYVDLDGNCLDEAEHGDDGTTGIGVYADSDLTALPAVLVSTFGQTLHLRVSTTLPGTLTLTKINSGAGSVGIYRNGNLLTGPIDVPAGGLDEDLGVLAISGFSSRVHIKASFLTTINDSRPSEDIITIRPVSLNFRIFHADSDPNDGTPFGNEVTGNDRSEVGAFTVANLNDTDGDGEADKSANDTVGFATDNGQKEHDLIRLLVEPPEQGVGGSITVSANPDCAGRIRVWATPVKLQQITLPKVFDVDGMSGPVELWVEATAASTVLRDIELTMTYTRGDQTIATDAVKATAVWATVTALTNNMTFQEVGASLGTDWQQHGAGTDGNGPYWQISYSPDRRLGPDFYATGGIGVNTDTVQEKYGRLNVALFQFQISPANINTVPVAHRPKFDMTRQAHGLGVLWDNPAQSDPSVLYPFRRFPAQNEQPNDDGSDMDETTSPTDLGRMWVVDSPGALRGVSQGRLIAMRINFFEFMRVRFDGKKPSASDKPDGSRCSEKKKWSTKSTGNSPNAPCELVQDHFTFANEVFETRSSLVVHRPLTVDETGEAYDVTASSPGVRYHVYCRGLSRMTNTEDPHLVFAALYSNPAIPVQISSNLRDVPVPAGAGVGDVIPFTIATHYATTLDGRIVGSLGSSSTTTANLAFNVGGAGDPLSTPCEVSGTAISPLVPTPTIPGTVPGTLDLGKITTMTLANAWIETVGPISGTQDVTVRFEEARTVFSNKLLDDKTVAVPQKLTDEVSGMPVNSWADAAIPLGQVTGRIAAMADGTVLGPNDFGSGSTINLFAKVGSRSSVTQVVKGQAYSMAAPTITTSPIPVGGTSNVSMQVYVEATGSTGNENFFVRLIDSDVLSDDLLETIPVTFVRPTGCFAFALIGPKTVNTTLLNPSPGGVVRGADGGSGEKNADIGYEIGESSSNSPTVVVTAD